MMFVSVFLLILGCLTIVNCDKRCFECTDQPFPSDCRKVIECPDDYECYVSQFITSGGLVLYNSGCHSKQRCQQLTRRRSDLLVCEECCQGELCNNAGCGTTVPARVNRGPYCFACDSQLDPVSCRNIDNCEVDEWCSIKFESHTQHYVTECMPKLQCSALLSLPTEVIGKRSPRSAGQCFSCCADDYCNDNCTLAKPVVATGSWSDWSTWSSCPVTCGYGQRSRVRQCDGGTGCVGDYSMVEICSAAACVHSTANPVTASGTWTQWSSWTICTVSCGGGQRTRLRSCVGGTGCVGDSLMTESCSVSCHHTTGSSHGVWSSWSTWGSCSQTCGFGNKYRTRICSSGQCVGKHSETVNCYTHTPCNNMHNYSKEHCKEEGFDYYKIEGHIGCLKLIKHAMTFSAGQEACRRHGAELFTAENSKKQHVMDEYLTRMHAAGKPFVWLGLRNYGHQWMWEGQSPYPLTNSMYNNFLNNLVVNHIGRACVILNTHSGSTFYWYMHPCDGVHYFLCELK